MITKKERQSNFELLRIIAMFLILLLHANLYIHGGGTQEDVMNNPNGMMVKLLWDSLCCVGVNIFVMISGWFGIKPTLKGVVSLLFQVYFYCLLIIGVALCFGIPVEMKWVFKMFFFGCAYWFVTEYLILYFFSPVLNNFVENSNPKVILRLLTGFFILEICLGWMVQLSGFMGGFSAIHFFGLYLLIRYIKLYGNKIKQLSRWSYMVIYLLCSIIPAIIGFYGRYYVSFDFGQLHYSSPFVIVASLSVVLLFSKITFNSKIINWIACSAFAIYLVHVNPVILPYYKSLLQLVFHGSSVIYFLLSSIVFSVIIGTICVCLDKIRLFIWDWSCSSFLNSLFDKYEGWWKRE